MKKLYLFESAIIGLFVGVVVATYMVYLNSMGEFIGRVLNWVSLIPVMDALGLSMERSLLLPFLYIVFVFIVYGVIVGLLITGGKKVKISIVAIILLLIVVAYFEQTGSAAVSWKVSHDTQNLMAAVVSPVIHIDRTREKVSEQYFGQEASGDLNGDGEDDIAFIASRKDPDRGMLYYLLASIKIEGGYIGTNLVFLGDKVEPQSLNIALGIIDIDYRESSIKTATSSKYMYAKIVDGTLNLIEEKELVVDTASTTVQ